MKINKITIALCLLTGMVINAHAQLYPLGTMYYQNQYIGNPAMAGMNEGLHLNGVFRKQWSSIPGSPSNQSVTAEYRLKEKVGLGVNLYNDEAGLLKRTRAAATYAYHLPLNNENHKIHMGLSLGLMYDRVMNEKVNGDLDDISVTRFNKRETYLDGDFGIAYSSEKLTIQGAIPNLKQVVKKDEFNIADRSTFFTAISYKWTWGEGINHATITPKIVYRGIEGHDNLVDAGANIMLISDQLSLTGIYHSTKNATFGVGMTYNQLSFLGMYTTTTSTLSSYTNGNFEVGIKYSFVKNKIDAR